MVCNNNAPTSLGSLSPPQQELYLTDMNPRDTCSANNHDLPLGLYHDTNVTPPQTKKAAGGTEIQTVYREIANALIGIAKLLEKRGRGGEAQISYKKAEKLG